MPRLTKSQRIARLVSARGPLERRHARLAASDRGSTRHEAWGVCGCSTAMRLRNVAVALATIRTPSRDVRRCEGCNAPAVTADAEDVPLCRPCAKACCESSRPTAASGDSEGGGRG